MSPGDFFMGLFGGVLKAGSSPKAAAEKLEAKLLKAIDGVQGRGRCIISTFARRGVSPLCYSDRDDRSDKFRRRKAVV